MRSTREDQRIFPGKRSRRNLNGQFSDHDDDNRNAYKQHNHTNNYEDYDDDEDNVQSNYHQDEYGENESDEYDEEED